MRIDFSEIQDIESFINIPEGSYLCTIADIKVTHTREGSPRWSLRLDVADGEFAGRIAGWDSLVWSERGLSRVREVLGLLGFDVGGVVDIQPDDLRDKRLRAQFVAEVWENEQTGKPVHRLRVPYRGYGAAEVDTPY